jgi:predicted regulator of Ras-like GTPase activity (Roadblock/LC7/MglB family)
VDAEQAIADLMEVSSQVDAAVVVGPNGAPGASSLPPERAGRLARAASQLVEAAALEADGRELTQVEAATPQGSLFVVRDGDRTLAAATGPTPTVGLVFYDLRTCLQALAEGEPEPVEPKPRRRRKKAEESDADA